MDITGEVKNLSMDFLEYVNNDEVYDNPDSVFCGFKVATDENGNLVFGKNENLYITTNMEHVHNFDNKAQSITENVLEEIFLDVLASACAERISDMAIKNFLQPMNKRTKLNMNKKHLPVEVTEMPILFFFGTYPKDQTEDGQLKEQLERLTPTRTNFDELKKRIDEKLKKPRENFIMRESQHLDDMAIEDLEKQYNDANKSFQKVLAKHVLGKLPPSTDEGRSR